MLRALHLVGEASVLTYAQSMVRSPHSKGRKGASVPVPQLLCVFAFHEEFLDLCQV